jgi:hypothetical protein
MHLGDGVAATLRLMRDVPTVSIVAALVIGLPVAVGVGAYSRRFTAG